MSIPAATLAARPPTGGFDPDGVYAACIEVIEGIPAGDAAKPVCEAAREAFQECLDSPSPPENCDEAARRTIDGLESGGDVPDQP